MTTIATFLLGIAGTLAGRVLLALGFGFVSYAGISVALDSVRGHVVAAWSVGGPIINIMFLAGLGEAVGIILAALAVRSALYGVSQLRRVSA